MALIVTSSVIAAIMLDHFGLVGFEVHAVNVWRIGGALLMILGGTLIALF
jgi:bacterial/archaeal transporter family-2 protein